MLGEMMRAGGITSDANLVRVALWSLADHMGLDVPNGVFDLRQYVGSAGQPRVARTTPNPKVRQDRPWRQPKQPKTHPWAQAEAAFHAAKPLAPAPAP